MCMRRLYSQIDISRLMSATPPQHTLTLCRVLAARIAAVHQEGGLNKFISGARADSHQQPRRADCHEEARSIRYATPYAFYKTCHNILCVMWHEFMLQLC